MRNFPVKEICAVVFFHFFIHYISFASRYPVSTNLGIGQGLSNNSVRCIYQDQEGFMWFGTYDGLNRYDGYQFKIFRNNFKNDQSLINNWINAINEDPKGNLWIGTRQGACIYQKLSSGFSPLYYYSANNKINKIVSVIRDIESDSYGNMFLATADMGIFFFPKGETIGHQIRLADTKSLQYDATSLKSTKDGKLWAFAANRGLYAYDYKTQKLHLKNATIKSANYLESTDGYLWIGSNEGVFRFNIAFNSFDRNYNVANKKLNYNSVAGITAGKENELWIATNGGGAVVLNTETNDVQFLSNTKEPNSLSSNAVYSIWIDAQSRKWIGTLRGGINVIDPNKERFQNIVSSAATTNTLISNYILSFYEAPNSDLWIGTDGGGLSIWDRKLNSFTNYQNDSEDPNSLSDNFVTGIQSDFQNSIWITTYRGGVNHFNSGRFEHYDCIDPNNPTLTLHPIGPTILEDAERNLWLSTQQYGLFKLNRQKKVFETFDDKLRDLYVLKEDRNHVFWGGSINYLFQIDRIGKKHVSYFIGKPVNALLEDRSGNFWVGTEGGGLILFDKKQGKIITRYTTDEGLCSNSVLNILEDSEGNLWMSTFNGIAKFNPGTKKFRNYYQGDGLQSNQFNYHAALQLRSGEFAFGGINGFSLFHPESIIGTKSNPKVYLTDVKIANASPEEDSSLQIKRNSNRIELIKIPYQKAVLSFEFAALEYSAPDKIQYAYYLQGSDKDWNYCGNNRKVLYSRLSEGTYTFRVKNTNPEGQWSNEEVQLKIIVLPPWYRSWWAYSIYALLIGTGFYLYLKYRAKQTRLQYEVKISKLNEENERSEKERSFAELAAEKAELEKERAEREKEHAEREKERILNEKEREINEKKISFFTNISHEFRTPLTLIINPVKELLEKNPDEQTDKSELNIVYRNARRMLSLVDQLLLFRKAESGLDKIKPSKLNLHELAYEVYLCFVQQAKAQRINYVFDCKFPNLYIHADREKLEIILYNLLSNALKYTPAEGSIKLLIEDAVENVVIKVIDSGAGIPSDIGERLFDKFYKAERTKTSSKPGFGIGLFLVKHFTEQHKGMISYESQEGQGSTFALMLQKGTDHFEAGVVISETEAAPQLLEALKNEAEPGESNANDHPLTELVSERESILIIDDDESIRQYLVRLFKDTYIVYHAENGEIGLVTAQKYLPDLIISDIHMKEMSGIELCKEIKENGQLSHIPVILLTGATSDELRLQGVEGGADDYIVKPFDSKLLIARVTALLKNRNKLQKYFYNEITLNKNDSRISSEYREFLEKCIAIVERHLRDKNFSVQTLLFEMGMSHSNLLRKVKSVSGQPVNIFIRSIRLRKAAELFINTGYSIKETAYTVGIRDIKYFREQFNKLFGMNPSDYIKKYRKVHGKQYTIDRESINPTD